MELSFLTHWMDVVFLSLNLIRNTYPTKTGVERIMNSWIPQSQFVFLMLGWFYGSIVMDFVYVAMKGWL